LIHESTQAARRFVRLKSLFVRLKSLGGMAKIQMGALLDRVQILRNGF
jgi:hypothetical protein